jgi:hypothetical protein
MISSETAVRTDGEEIGFGQKGHTLVVEFRATYELLLAGGATRRFFAALAGSK